MQVPFQEVYLGQPWTQNTACASFWPGSGLLRNLALQGNMAIKKVVILLPQQQTSESRPAEKVLHFPRGMHLLGFPEAFPTQSVFIRTCYADLHAIMDRYSAGDGPVRIWYFMGTPGIGKSYLGGLFVMKLLRAGKKIIWQNSTKQDGQMAFTLLTLQSPDGAGSVRMLSAHETWMFLKSKPTTVYVVDGAEPGISSKTHAAPVLVFASPKKRFREPIKLPQTCKVLIVPPFSQDELLDMQALMLFAKLYRTDDVSDKIFHMVPLKPATSPRETSPVKLPRPRHYLEGSIKIATEFVHALLVQRLYLGSSLSARLNIVTQENLLETAAANGYQLESLVHLLAVKGGELKCRWLDSQEDFTMQLKAAKPASFHSAAQLMQVAQVDGSIYALPTSTTYPAVDSAVTPCIYLQSAKAKSHTLQVDALKELRQALGSSGKQESAFQAAASLIHPPRVFKKPLVVMVTTPAHFDDSYKQLQMSKGAQPKPVTSVMQAVATIPIEDWAAAHLTPLVDPDEHSVEGSSGTAHIDQDRDGGALTSEPHDSGMEIDHGLPMETHQASTGWSGIKRQHRSDQL
ncbi:hypothetical protein WJX74_007345 [Apatococcus lobatus]|uniref:Uncharacterized protein n=1 Tax=Apatococcus lobatus TaxID=904363 RepID=A0AAW1QLH6_9CHLO